MDLLFRATTMRLSGTIRKPAASYFFRHAPAASNRLLSTMRKPARQTIPAPQRPCVPAAMRILRSSALGMALLLFGVVLPRAAAAASPAGEMELPPTILTTTQSEEGEAASASKRYFSSIPNIKPLEGPLTSGFGLRHHPLYGRQHFHHGVDIAARTGSRVMATGDGIVSFAGYERGYGQKIVISHGYGFTTLYAHLSKALVRQGQRVRRGEVIALSGNTGISTGPHLHYEVHKEGIRTDPTAYFFDTARPEEFITIEQHPEAPDGNQS